MLQNVVDAFPAFSEPLEGRKAYMYTDIKGLVTIGIGCLIDSPAAAIAIAADGAPFVHKSDGSAATDAEVSEEWQRVKNDTSIVGHANLAESITFLKLTEEGIDSLLQARLGQFDGRLRQTPEFGSLDQWPADAQLALASMAWAMGPAFAEGGKWPNFRAAVGSQSWVDAAANCNMSNDFLTKRNAVNRGLFRNAAWAAQVVDPPRDASLLYLAVPGNRPTLHPGDTDATHAGAGFDSETNVTDAQNFLAWLGMFAGAITGTMDDDTVQALRAFQSGEKGFPVTGNVGPLTWAALGFVVPRD
jgi:peptidoglycan hydrolase-like protein with peptidoglycan-binding domain